MSGESERTGGDNEKRGEEIGWGKGDPRVLFVMGLVPSTVSAAAVVCGPSCIDLVTLSIVNVTSVALVFTAITYLVTNRNRGMDHRPILRANYPQATAGGRQPHLCPLGNRLLSKIPIEDRDDAYLIMHTLVKDTLSRLRDVEMTQVAFRKGLIKLGCICGYGIIDGVMEAEYAIIQTLLVEVTGERVKGPGDVVIINALRTVTSSMEGLLRTSPRTKQGAISVSRGEGAGMDGDGGLPITIDYVRLPKITGRDTVTAADSTLATGSTMCSVLDHTLGNAGVDPGKLFVLSAALAPDGLFRVDNEFLEVSLLAVTINDYLDNDGYIIPDLGDTSDRVFCTTQLGLVPPRPTSPRLVASRLADGRDDRRPGFG